MTSISAKNITQHFHTVAHGVPLELRSTFNSLQPYKAHHHAELSVGAIVAGKTCARYGECSRIPEAGDVVIIPPGLVHACNPVDGEPRSYHMLYIDPDWFKQLHGVSVACLGQTLTVLKQPALFRQYLTVVEAVSGRTAFGEITQLMSAFCRSLTERYESTVSEPVPDKLAEISGVSAQVRQEFVTRLSSPPSLNELADKYHLRPETIIRHFTRDFGITPKALVNNLRVEQGKKLLRAGYSIVDTAQMLGFSDQSQFHKAFVQYTAATPNQYRQAGQFLTINKRV